VQAQRRAEVATALAVARHRGWVVAMATFTVRHNRRQSLARVWGAVGDCWRYTAEGSPRAWKRDRLAFGVRGYLRLTEVTRSEVNGWHVHLHVLIFCDPYGTDDVRRAPMVGPVRGRIEVTDGRAAVEGPRDRTGYFASPEDRTGTLHPDARFCVWPPRAQRRPDVVVGTCQVDASRAIANADAERRRRVLVGGYAEPALYLRDLRDLGASMFARWRRKAADLGMTPSDVHGWDVRLVGSDGCADYFAKNSFSLSSVEGAASEVTLSSGKVAAKGSRTPFAILADAMRGDADSLDLWREWEKVSRGRRQLRWSDGMRALLGLAPEVADEDLDLTDDGADLLALDPDAWRRVTSLGLASVLLRLAETDLGQLRAVLGEWGIPWRVPWWVHGSGFGNAPAGSVSRV
jgi:hypothetical protein